MRILCIKLSWALLIYLCYSSASKIEPRATQPGQGDLCYFYRHRSAVAGEKLYFMGGFYTIEGGSTNENEQQLFRVDLSSSFAVNGILPASSVVTSPAPPNSNWKGAGAFFVDDTDTILYSYGGFERDYEPQNSMAMYNTTSQSWSTVTVSGGNLNQGDREESMYTSSLGTDLSLSFIQGGYTSAMGPSAWLESASATNLTGMITFNSSDASNLSWTNSTKFSNAPETMGAKMQFVRYGRSGVLIAFGGFNTLYNETFRAMSQIMVYDIASTTWYNVTASGDIPANRDLFCITMSSAPDGSSSNIIMYGGWTVSQGRSWQDIYILSVPSFQWILVNDPGYTHNGRVAIGHRRMSCHLYQGRQMIVLGGDWTRGVDVINNVSCNAAYPSVRALDTTNITWATQWTHTSEPYQVPKVVYKRIGGNETGGATMTQPQGGFNDSLHLVFSQTIPLSSTSPTKSPAPSSPSPSSKSRTPIGAIVGGVIGGIAAIVIFIGSIFCLRAQRRRKVDETAAWQKPELPESNAMPRTLGIYPNEDGQAAERYEVPGDLHEADVTQNQMDRGRRAPEVHELGSEHRVPEMP